MQFVTGVIEATDQIPDAVRLLLLIVVAFIVQRIVIRLLRRAYWRRVEVLAQATVGDNVHRTQREQTILTLLESVIRYAIFGTVLICVIALFVPDAAANALFGASLLVVVVGFGLQRFLGDVIAGMLLLFEGHYRVGDVITVQQANGICGIVEEFTLRATTLRTLSGDRIVILNGSVTSVTKWTDARRALCIEFLVQGDAQQVRERCVQFCRDELSGITSHWVTPPQLSSLKPIADRGDLQLMRCEIHASIPPMLSVLVDTLAPTIEQFLGEQLVGSVVVSESEPAALDAYMSALVTPRG